MWMSSEDARSDFILAAAGMALGTEVLRFVLAFVPLPGGQFGSLLGSVLTIVLIVLLTVLVARFFVSYRDQGIAGYGLREDQAGLAEGALVAAPLLIAGYVRALQAGLGPVGSLMGRARPLSADAGASVPPLDLTLGVVIVGVAALGAMMMYGLLTTRAREAFRSPDMPLVQALRTFGLGAVAISTLLGLMIAVGNPSLPLSSPVFDGIALGAVVLLTDRMVDAGDRTTRATILAPAIAGLVVAIVIVGGGLFGPGLPIALWRGTAGGAVIIVVSTLIETRRASWAAVPLVAVAMWSPTCTTLPIGPGYGLGGCL